MTPFQFSLLTFELRGEVEVCLRARVRACACVCVCGGWGGVMVRNDCCLILL